MSGFYIALDASRTHGRLPIAAHLRPNIPSGAADDIAMACSRVEAGEPTGRLSGGRYKVQFIPASVVHELAVAGEA